jgi:hypothetical protein
MINLSCGPLKSCFEDMRRTFSKSIILADQGSDEIECAHATSNTQVWMGKHSDTTKNAGAHGCLDLELTKAYRLK